MDDAQLGQRIKAIRIRQRRTQDDLAEQADVRARDVTHLERGMLDELTIPVMRKILAALGMWIDLRPRWQGVDLDRLVSGAHDALQRVVLETCGRLPGWVAVPEVTFSIFGERGAIDILAWHAATRTLLIIELKTLLVDAGEVVRQMDTRRRLALEIAAARGWHPTTVSLWLVLTDTRTNRRRVDQHAAILRPLMSLDGRAMRAWLRHPSGPVAALSFWTEPSAVIRHRVRLTNAERAAAMARAKPAATRRDVRAGAK
jgi:transcriptional regulator with XRE-family HTH domain